tara:strand:- start:814 stop:1173 length:360 start_codon:yes stop_codon:yes gene_type:complete
MDRIRIINLRIPARHGVYEFEKDRDGLFELDIELYLDLSVAGISDQLNDTIDYDEAVGFITDIFTEKDHALIESVGEDICRELLSKYSLCKVALRIRKPHAPIKADFDTVEVELIRENK